MVEAQLVAEAKVAEECLLVVAEEPTVVQEVHTLV
jgi:hypothetical protein